MVQGFKAYTDQTSCKDTYDKYSCNRL